MGELVLVKRNRKSVSVRSTCRGLLLAGKAKVCRRASWPASGDSDGRGR